MSDSAFSIDPSHPFAAALNPTRLVSHSLADDGRIPNNPRLALAIYPGVLRLSREGRSAAAFVQDLFHENGWAGSWVNGVFSYHHFHAKAHEVLGCFDGRATVLFGGENGVEVDILAGDAVVIPAGVGHKNLGCSSDFGVVGAYPPGQSPDMKYGEPDERPRCLEEIALVDSPETDPVYGAGGPLLKLWRN